MSGKFDRLCRKMVPPPITVKHTDGYVMTFGSLAFTLCDITFYTNVTTMHPSPLKQPVPSVKTAMNKGLR